MDGVDKKLHKMAVAALIFGVLAMNEVPTTVIIQRYLDALPGDAAAEPIIRELPERAAGRLRLLCGTLLHSKHGQQSSSAPNAQRRCSNWARRRRRCAATAPSCSPKSGSGGGDSNSSTRR
jgi:hypothetical protein